MSEHLHTWVDGHLAVRSRAYETRGSVTIDTGAVTSHDTLGCRVDRRAGRSLRRPTLRTHRERADATA